MTEQSENTHLCVCVCALVYAHEHTDVLRGHW